MTMNVTRLPAFRCGTTARSMTSTESIGRWQNYAEHFDASWEALDAL